MRMRILGILAGLWLALPTGVVGAFSCTLNATSLNFGNYDMFAATPRDAIGTISVNCNIPPRNPFAPLLVTLSISPGGSGSFAERQLQGPGAVLSYNLFTNPSFSTVWGDGGGSSAVQTNYVDSSTPWTATVYGRIPAHQNVPAGSYSDILTVTVVW